MAYCVTRNSNPNALSSREQTRESDPYQLNALFFDSSDGQLLSTKTWPTRAGTQSDIFPAGDKLFLLVAGDSVSLVDLKRSPRSGHYRSQAQKVDVKEGK